ncbi:hypothetical protein GCM10023328_37960 [Modestobacter marinus]|uniref:Uncharacterized protein n=2 Tax=Modestobacter marinus TaxID=477641 RepID=A0A846LTB8_9ACTN|nr:hypothetical protein [Modestobacter marinus]NIH69664.1 hypothetical protein [Modestobacter marinus]GGL75690.1 hypothetical protein GCM10011589_34650 [Modestobacter marinus]
MTAPGPDWVEQVRRLAAGLAAEHAAGTRVTDVLGDLLGAPAARPAAPRPEDDAATAGPQPADECRWCPVCQGLAALRGRRPDLVDALADVLTSAATALRTHAGTHAGTHASTHAGSDAGTHAGSDAGTHAGSPAGAHADGQAGDPADSQAGTHPDSDAGTPTSTRPADRPRTNPDGSVAAPGAPAPDVRTADASVPPEETVTHPAPAPVQRIDVA